MGIKEVLENNTLRMILIIMGLIAVLLGMAAMYGCSAWNSHLKKLPDAEFASFEWHRGGNATSADVIATNGKIEAGKLSVDNISITENWGPFFTLNVSLKGYKRTIAPADTSTLPEVPISKPEE